MKNLKNLQMPLSNTNLISFLKKYLGGPNDIDVDKLKSEYEKIKEENTKLRY
jgi:hypothetical protein